MSSINETNEGEEDQYNPYFGEAWDTFHPPGATARSPVGRSRSIAGSSTQASSQAPSRLGINSAPRTTPPSSFEKEPPLPNHARCWRHPATVRSPSFPLNRDRSPVFGSPSPESSVDDYSDDGVVVWNNTVAQLSALSHSNQTLSPYTRSPVAFYHQKCASQTGAGETTKWSDPRQEETTVPPRRCEASPRFCCRRRGEKFRGEAEEYGEPASAERVFR
jgi:hypothetical protein